MTKLAPEWVRTQWSEAQHATAVLRRPPYISGMHFACFIYISSVHFVCIIYISGVHFACFIYISGVHFACLSIFPVCTLSVLSIFTVYTISDLFIFFVGSRWACFNADNPVLGRLYVYFQCLVCLLSMFAMPELTCFQCSLLLFLHISSVCSVCSIYISSVYILASVWFIFIFSVCARCVLPDGRRRGVSH